MAPASLQHREEDDGPALSDRHPTICASRACPTCMRHARQARAAAGPAQLLSRPPFDSNFDLFIFCDLLSDALINLQ
jgi:hypothetical protein